MEYNVPGKKVSMKKLFEMAKQDGFEGSDALVNWNKWRRENGKMPSCTKIDKDNNERIAKNAGYASLKEYDKVWLENCGFENRAEYNRLRRWNNGICEPVEFNVDCTSYFGIEQGEKLFVVFLKDIFDDVKWMGGKRDGGIDFICRNPKKEFIDKYPNLKLEKEKDYKIQLRMRCLESGNVGWNFAVEFNDADYFIFVGWDNRNDLNIMHIWMINRYEIIRGRQLWERRKMIITDNSVGLETFLQYELIDELEKLKTYCNKMKDGESVDT